jgi:hypothetical protein
MHLPSSLIPAAILGAATLCATPSWAANGCKYDFHPTLFGCRRNFHPPVLVMAPVPPPPRVIVMPRPAYPYRPYWRRYPLAYGW